LPELQRQRFGRTGIYDTLETQRARGAANSTIRGFISAAEKRMAGTC
jgi:hypothetical protein